MTRGLLAACCLLLLSCSQALAGSEQAPIRITAPAEGALLEAGDLLVVEVALGAAWIAQPCASVDEQALTKDEEVRIADVAVSHAERSDLFPVFAFVACENDDA